MKYLKSLFVAAFCSSLTFASFSQTETTNDSDCQSTRWFIVKNNEQNTELFASLPEIFEEIKRQNDLKVLFATRESLETGPIVDAKGNPILQETADGGTSYAYQTKTVTYVQSDVPIVDRNGDPIIATLNDGTQSYVFPEPVITCFHYDAPLINKNGTPIIKTLDDGTMHFTYSDPVNFTVQPRVHVVTEKGEFTSMETDEPTNYALSEYSISELRIIQSRKYDVGTGKYSDEYHVSRIGFCMNPSATEQERIWIDLVSFFKNMENPEENAFYSLLSEGAFDGFQYRQTPCE